MGSFISSLWTWLVLIVAVVLGFFVMLPIAVCTHPFDPTRKHTGLVFRRIARTVARLSPQWRFRALAPYPPTLPGPHVVVSNHESHLDAFLISFLPYEMKWLAKDSLFRLPFIGWCMALAGDVKVVRGKNKSVQHALMQCRRLLDQGMHVLLFPEGTRATTPDLLPFKDGAFRLALEARVPILPLAVAGTAHGLRKNSLRFYKSRAEVCVGEPVDITPWLQRMAHKTHPLPLGDATRELKEVVHQRIAAMRRQLREDLQLSH